MKKIHHQTSCCSRCCLLFTLTLLCLFPVCMAPAQSVVKKKYLKKKEAILINKGDTLIEIHAASLFKKNKPRINKRYYWYRQADIYQTVGGYDGRLLHGPYKKFIRKSNLAEKGNFRYGLKHGQWMAWQPDGSLLYTEKWRNGKKAGNKTCFFRREKTKKVTEPPATAPVMKTSPDTLIKN